ncbi:MAG: hypothetical protein PHG35_02080 [Dehalococcoidales bacterium]|nr:hypothetical protein [Dehalococcoidales bacterium]
MSKQPRIEDRIELELHRSQDLEGYYIMQVWLDGECLLTIWCDNIGFYPTARPPMYTLEMGGVGVSFLSSKVLRVRWDAAELIPKETLDMIKNYVKIIPKPQSKAKAVRK